ncbi:O-methylsterigmatocystin oxidoreductase [Ceratobasidium theobromae]|uniref:O-methylsterigmatocystin oxidoreductase n=1 Tax=Ceratobasidium theobromae TaxID=1582974 RepID=A0A5N5Q9U7_9AGAM|nr:O-methylsterigmatocystin oxidoreductase [Ceratobasidium theobromae]
MVSSGITIGAILALQAWSRRRSPQPPLPPGPKSYPLIDNLLSMPSKDEHLAWIELGKELNTDIFSLKVFGTVIIVLNSVEDAIELLEKRSSIYSDRSCPPMVAEPSLVYWPQLISLLGYNDRWRKNRRLIHPWLHKKASEAFHSSQQQEAHLLLHRLSRLPNSLDTSEKLYGEFFRTLANTLMRSIYGYTLESLEDPLLVEIQKALDNVVFAAVPSNFLVNTFPVLRHVPEWFPGASWKRTAREWREHQQKVVKDAFNWTTARIASGNYDPCIVSSLIPHAEKLGLTPAEIEDYVSQIAIMLFGGLFNMVPNNDTSNTFMTFALAMILYPDAQAKAQQEIDTVIGKDRLPTMEDRGQLPYTNRLIQELLRWCPIVPSGVPHACFQDDVYQGYHIPKGAIVAMSRNEKVYKNPEEFNPDRFLDPSVPPFSAFGFGRRLCPGIHFAEASVFIVIASVLSTFTISMAKDENGKDAIPKMGSRNTIVYHPDSFKLKIEPRSEHHANLARTGA